MSKQKTKKTPPKRKRLTSAQKIIAGLESNAVLLRRLQIATCVGMLRGLALAEQTAARMAGVAYAERLDKQAQAVRGVANELNGMRVEQYHSLAAMRRFFRDNYGLDEPYWLRGYDSGSKDVLADFEGLIADTCRRIGDCHRDSRRKAARRL